MTPKLLITSYAHQTVLELLLEHDTGPDAQLAAIVDSRVFKPSAMLVELRMELTLMWERWYFSTTALENQPIPPLPTVQWTHHR